MDEEYKKIFDLYKVDDFYVKQINNDNQYIENIKKLYLIQNELKIYLESHKKDTDIIEKLNDI